MSRLHIMVTVGLDAATLAVLAAFVTNPEQLATLQAAVAAQAEKSAALQAALDAQPQPPKET